MCFDDLQCSIAFQPLNRLNLLKIMKQFFFETASGSGIQIIVIFYFQDERNAEAKEAECEYYSRFGTMTTLTGFDSTIHGGYHNFSAKPPLGRTICDLAMDGEL